MFVRGVAHEGEHALDAADDRRFETHLHPPFFTVGGAVEPLDGLWPLSVCLLHHLAGVRRGKLTLVFDDVLEGQVWLFVGVVPEQLVETAVRLDNLAGLGVVDDDAVAGLLENLLVLASLLALGDDRGESVADDAVVKLAVGQVDDVRRPFPEDVLRVFRLRRQHDRQVWILLSQRRQDVDAVDFRRVVEDDDAVDGGLRKHRAGAVDVRRRSTRDVPVGNRRELGGQVDRFLVRGLDCEHTDCEAVGIAHYHLTLFGKHSIYKRRHHPVPRVALLRWRAAWKL